MNNRESIALLARPFYFLRHGETESNRLEITAGSLDVDLNATGVAQAHAAIELARPLNVTHIASSNLKRARDTAAIIARALALPHVIVPELAERNWGSLEGQPRSMRVPGAPLPEDAETSAAFRSRTAAGLAQVRADGVPLVVAHSGTYRVLCRLLDLAEAKEAEVAVVNCRPVRVSPPAGPDAAWSLELL